MALKVYFPSDIRDALLAVEHAVNATVDATGNRDDPFATGYLAGYHSALATLALAFSLTLHLDPSLSDTDRFFTVRPKRRKA